MARDRGLAGKVALVTGAGRGIGLGIARCLAEEGMHLALADVSLPGVEQAAEEIAALGVKAVPLACDVLEEASCQAAVNETIERLGGLHTLVNNAGVLGGPDLHLGLMNITAEDWDAAFRVNVRGIFFMIRSATAHFKAQKEGCIINISSRAGKDGRLLNPQYSSSKAAVINLTQALAREFAPSGVTVNAVCPGVIWSAMWEKLAGLMVKENPKLAGLSAREVFDDIVRQTPMGLAQTPEDIGRAVAFLASADARTITGQALSVDSGSVMH
ncbi:MAG: SDR family NAD(P)-dependent oxidoreductase [bacterium]|nr:SDR family NAD(P)-dependent oxidoreductase [bacterium]